MANIKRFGFGSWYCIIAASFIIALIDYYAASVIQDAGGFTAWQEVNSMWECGCAYLFVLHFFYCVTLWLVWICAED